MPCTIHDFHELFFTKKLQNISGETYKIRKRVKGLAKSIFQHSNSVNINSDALTSARK